MTKEVWTRDQWNPVYKTINVYGPDDVVLMVDYDDVNRIKVQDTVDTMLVVLNNIWGVE